MYGVINMSVRELVLEKFGAPAWEDVLAEAGMSKDLQWVLYENYPDSVTVSIVLAAAAKLGVDADSVLELYGVYFVKYLKDNDLDRLLYIMGSQLKEFLFNLDYLHAHLADTFQGASFPHFHVEDEDGSDDAGFKLHYQSTRGSLLAPFVKGLVSTIAKEIFEKDVEITAETNDRGAVFHIKDQSGDCGCVEKRETSAKVAEREEGYALGARILSEEGMDLRFLLKCWPFFVILEADMTITCCGPALSQRIPAARQRGRFDEIFEVLRPVAAAEDFVFSALCRHNNVAYKVQSREPLACTNRKLVLRGAMHFQAGRLLFLCSPHMLTIDDMAASGCHMTDLPLHDATRDLLFMAETRTAEATLNKRLDRLRSELEVEQARSDDLLYSMLPRPVVEDLRDGRRARGAYEDMVTILFADIVGFTNICAAVHPQRVVSMLDEVYTAFDALSANFEVYKVGTVGDAYLIAGGIVGDKAAHATSVADMAFAMHRAVRKINAPNSKQPLAIRVGIHSGPVMTGVLGTKMPKFCFFGDTVNTASRMESGGEPGRIQVTAVTAELLRAEGYAVESRGIMQVKGKGSMQTFWLTRYPDRCAQRIEAGLKGAEEARVSLRALLHDVEELALSDEAAQSDEMEGVVSSSSDSSPQISRAASTGSKSGRSLGVLELWEPVRDPWSHSLWEPVRDPGSDEDTTAVIEEAKSRAAPVVDAQGGGGAKAKQPRDLTVLWRNSTFRNSAQRLLEILDEGPSESPKSSLSATDVASSPRHMLRRSSTMATMRRRSSELEMGVLRSSLEPAPGAGAAGLCQRSPTPNGASPLPNSPRQPRAQVQALEEENAALRREVERLRAALAGRQAQDGGAERSAAPEDDFGRRSTTAVREKAAREVAAAFAQAHGAGRCPFGFDKLSRVADERARARAPGGKCFESTANEAS